VSKWLLQVVNIFLKGKERQTYLSRDSKAKVLEHIEHLKDEDGAIASFEAGVEDELFDTRLLAGMLASGDSCL
jgi:hypothetical protein